MQRRNLILAVTVIAILSTCGFLVFQVTANGASAAPARAAVAVTRGALSTTVSAAGNIYAPQQTNLNFRIANVEITLVAVQAGDQVKTGQVLAAVDSGDLESSLQSAAANLTSAQAKLDALKGPPSAADLAAARARVASAKASYDAAVAKSARAGDQIMVAKTNVEKMQVALEKAQAAYDKVGGASNPSIGMLPQAADLQKATIDYESARADYNLKLTDINDSAVKSAAQALAQAEADLAKLTTPKPEDLASAQAAADSARAALDQAKRKREQAKIIAPFDGTITAVNYTVGQLAGSGSTPMFTLVNLDSLETRINLSEVDIAKLKMDQDVTLTFDALGRRQVPGKIMYISPAGTITSGVVNYLVTVGLTQPDPAILPGMSVKASFTIARRENVLILPNRAIKRQGDQRIITLVREGKEIPAVVQTGLANELSTEIVSASTAEGAITLKEGDVVRQ